MREAIGLAVFLCRVDSLRPARCLLRTKEVLRIACSFRCRRSAIVPLDAQWRPVSMTAALTTLRVASRRQWRAWLTRHHTSSPGVWLVFHKAHTGVKSIHYEDTVREALCFGWIDSLIKRLDDDRYALKVTPRQPTSKWSDLNRNRWLG